MSLSLLQVVLHETAHMLAAARHGIKPKYGIGNRLWTIVAEPDLTGILTLPKSQRYFPMLAGLLKGRVIPSSATNPPRFAMKTQTLGLQRSAATLAAVGASVTPLPKCVRI